ncbi:MAG: putative 4-hydroxybenzoate polyprenyltransferase [Bacteroidia bacterium]|nr:putative 4-hydroxybenzoate polyprenyltransferase [Bacteroidia bacterium]
MNRIQKYLSLIKFSHTVFALPFALIGFFLAIYKFHYSFDWSILVKVLMCMVFARSAAMAFNRYIDRKFDAANPRTAIREIPAGLITADSALWFVVINALLFIGTTWFINLLCFSLSPVALLVILGYSFTKRFTPLCHLVLGVGLSLSPIGSFLAVSGKFELLPVLFSFGVMFWVSGFDIIYALQDEDFDRGQGLFSIPVWLGGKNALRLSEFLHLFCALSLFSAGFVGDFGMIYWLGYSIFISLLVYQHSIVKPNDLSRVNLAFATTNGWASVVFGILSVSDLFFR